MRAGQQHVYALQAHDHQAHQHKHFALIRLPAYGWQHWVFRSVFLGVGCAFHWAGHGKQLACGLRTRWSVTSTFQRGEVTIWTKLQTNQPLTARR
jgi:hypothetical protein